MKRTFSVVLLSCTIMQGCAFSPGQYMAANDVAEDSPEMGKVQLVPITAETLHDQAAPPKEQPLPAALLSYHAGEYRIGPGDSLFITVWEHPELTSPAVEQPIEARGRVVNSDGRVYFPYVNLIPAAGMTISEFRSELQSRLGAFVSAPKVDVSIVKYDSKWVVLSGAFKTSGPRILTNTPVTLVDAVSRAGVDNASANLADLILKRDGQEYRIDIDALNRKDSRLNEIYLKDGDQLHLGDNRQNTIYLLGEVYNPHVTNYGTSRYSLMQGLGEAGGIRQETANAEAVYVIRSATNTAQKTSTVYQLNAKKPSAFILAHQFYLEPQDVVFVGPANITRWNRYISQLLPSVVDTLGAGAALKH